jgi:hypothetical protein
MLRYSVPPGYQRQQAVQRPKLGPWVGVIDAILEEDKTRPAKQRHTAKRIFDRLREEHGFSGGYTIVKDYVRAATLHGREMFVPLRHPAGEAQVDFGEALVVIAGVERKAHYLAMDLPHSDDCFVVAFPAETTEAFLEGHVRAFAYFGGVPTRILYDYVPGNIIITKPPEDALEILEGKFMRFQKSLLRRTRIRPMEGRTTCHRTHLEDLQLDPFTIQIGIRFVPIDLRLDAPVVALRNEQLVFGQTQSLLAPLYILPNRPLRWRASRDLGTDPVINPPRRMALLARSLAVQLQNRVDQRHRRGHLHCRTFRLLALRRNCVPHCLPHHATVHAHLPRHTDHRPNAKLILPTNLLV